MSRLLNQAIILSTYVERETAAGSSKRELDSETTVMGNLQPDVSQEQEFGGVRYTVSTGKLFVSSATTINAETMTAKDTDNQEWDLVGPVVESSGSTAKWGSVRRRVRS